MPWRNILTLGTSEVASAETKMIVIIIHKSIVPMMSKIVMMVLFDDLLRLAILTIAFLDYQ